MGKLTRKDAESKLLNQPHDGAFLIRESESTLGKQFICQDGFLTHLYCARV